LPKKLDKKTWLKKTKNHSKKNKNKTWLAKKQAENKKNNWLKKAFDKKNKNK
jgi:hypothetical protein